MKGRSLERGCGAGNGKNYLSKIPPRRKNASSKKTTPMMSESLFPSNTNRLSLLIGEALFSNFDIYPAPFF
jgi:hypothetical protein